MSPFTFSRPIASTAALVIALTACGGSSEPEGPPPPAPAVEIAASNIAVVDSAVIETGPTLSGTLAAQRTAELRAQVTGTVVGVYADEGASVTAGQLLVRIEGNVLEDATRSATSQLRSAEASASIATRNAERAQRLNTAGAIAERDLEMARAQAIAADAMADDARSRLASAKKQLDNASIRAPFRGVVSERAASTGDVLQMGTPVVTVVDPSSLQLEASVPAATLGSIRRGAKVEFSVTGFDDRQFTGTIDRVNPTVDPATRQVRIYVAVPNADRALAAGLFAEGRVAVAQKRAMTIPLGAIDQRATVPSVKRIRGGKVEVVPVTFGLRDDVTERIEVIGGLMVGDTLLVGGALGAPAGSLVRISRANR